MNYTQGSQYARSLIEASLDPLVTISAEGKITDVNEASVKVTGVVREKLIGTDFSDYFTEPKKAEEGYQMVFEKGFVSDYPLTIKHKNGNLTDVLYNASVYKDEEGNVLGVFAAARDVTEQTWAKELRIMNKELLFQNDEKEKRAAELAIANEELAFQNQEKEKRAAELVIANKELAFQNEVKEKRAAELVIANEELAFQNNEKEKRAAELYIANEELIFQTSEKEKRAAELVIADIELAFQNKEKEKQEIANKELTEARVFAELATELAEEAKSKAESATIIAENAVKAKQQFLSNMSHEIRTPMNAIIGFTKVVLKTELTAKQKEYLTAIKISGDALIVLINDILDLAKVDAGKMTFEQTPFSMTSSISAMLHLFETKIQEKNLILVKEYDQRIPKVLVGDPVRLHQVILNLVSNAVKFTSTGKITVSVQLLKEDSETATIEFSVSDTGIGISDNKIEHIFDDFQQATSGTSRLYGGTGLGLAIVKQLVEPQGGIINVKSKIGEGSTFSFSLSFLKTDADAESDNGSVELDQNIKNIKVLVVEDIPLNQLLMKTLLDDFGFERDIASNGKIAIENLKHKTYDIILMDLQMPEMNGFEATEYIRNTLHSKVPIIALTADVTTMDLEKCKLVGMNDYIAKPVDDRLLYNKIIGLVKKPMITKTIGINTNSVEKEQRYTDLAYLAKITKSDPKLMMEMIELYLEQTPQLIHTMKISLENRDWSSLQAAAHKMIPSFSIMGINANFESIAKQIQDHASTLQQADGIKELVAQLETACNRACTELTEEFNRIKNTN